MAQPHLSSQAAPVDIIYNSYEPGPTPPPKHPEEQNPIVEGLPSSQTKTDQGGAGHADSVEHTLRSQTTSVYSSPGYAEPVSHPSQQTGYFTQTPQYNPSQAYDPYNYQQPPPKPDYAYYGGPPAGADQIPPPVTSTPAPAADSTARERRILGMSMTAFLLLCVVAFLIVSGAILGGVAGSGVFDNRESNNLPITTISPPQPPPSSTSTSPTTSPPTTPASTATSTSTAPPSTYTPYPIPTGVWDLSGKYSSSSGQCIQSLNSTIFKEVWACDDSESLQITIRDLSSDKGLVYWLDLEGTAIKGVDGEPPTSKEVDIISGKNPFWTFTLPEITKISPDVPGCEVQSTLIIMLGSTRSVYAWVDTIYSAKACSLPSGQMSLPSLSCSCIYGPPGGVQ